MLGYFLIEKRTFVTTVLFFGLSLAMIFLITGLGLLLASLLKKRFLFRQAEEEELKREDDILLQSTAFSQSILFIYLTLMEPTELILALKFFIPFFAFLFYTVRAYAKLKNSNQYRFLSMQVLGLVLGISIATLLLPFKASLNMVFQINGEISTIDFTTMVFNSIALGFLFSMQELFKTRYLVK
jgi:hypothetical protein